MCGVTPALRLHAPQKAESGRRKAEVRVADKFNSRGCNPRMRQERNRFHAEGVIQSRQGLREHTQDGETRRRTELSVSPHLRVSSFPASCCGKGALPGRFNASCPLPSALLSTLPSTALVRPRSGRLNLAQRFSAGIKAVFDSAARARIGVPNRCWSIDWGDRCPRERRLF